MTEVLSNDSIDFGTAEPRQRSTSLIVKQVHKPGFKKAKVPAAPIGRISDAPKDVNQAVFRPYSLSRLGHFFTKTKGVRRNTTIPEDDSEVESEPESVEPTRNQAAEYLSSESSHCEMDLRQIKGTKG